MGRVYADAAEGTQLIEQVLGLSEARKSSRDRRGAVWVCERGRSKNDSTGTCSASVLIQSRLRTPVLLANCYVRTVLQLLYKTLEGVVC